VSSEGQVRQVLELSRFDRFFHIKYANPDDPT
jgi:anti-anti-sigma regulatory factor